MFSIGLGLGIPRVILAALANNGFIGDKIKSFRLKTLKTESPIIAFKGECFDVLHLYY